MKYIIMILYYSVSNAYNLYQARRVWCSSFFYEQLSAFTFLYSTKVRLTWDYPQKDSSLIKPVINSTNHRLLFYHYIYDGILSVLFGASYTILIYYICLSCNEQKDITRLLNIINLCILVYLKDNPYFFPSI